MKEFTINNLCRVCLKNSNSFSNIYKDQSIEKFLVYELVNDVCDLDISVNDGLPEFLCGVCFGKILDFKSFKATAQKGRSAFLLLKERMENPIVKQEELDIDCDYGDGPEEPFEGINTEPIVKQEELNIDCDSGEGPEEPFDGINTEPIVKQEELNIDCDSGEEPLEGTNNEVRFGPILLKHEVLPFNRDNHPQEDLIKSEAIVSVDAVELPYTSMEDTTQQPDHGSSGSEFCEEDSIRGASADDEMEPLMLESEEETFESDKVEMTLEETVTHPKYLQCLENKRPNCTSDGEADGDSCSNDDSVFVKSSNISLSENIEASSSGTMEMLDGQKVLSGEGRNMAPFYQQDLSIRKEVDKERRRVEEDIGGDSEAYRVTGPEKGVRENRRGLECFHCGIVLMNKLVLVKHMKVHGYVNSYECAECDKVFRFNSQLNRHILTHTGYKPYKCAECSKCFTNHSNIKSHMRLHTGLKPYKCSKCSKCFAHDVSLKMHMMSHTGFKPYKCAECSKSFCQSSDLKTHLRIHTGSRPYKCTECNKSFSHSSSLKIHIRIHTGSKPYKCTECSKSFTTNCNLTAHMRIHTGSKPYKCAECNKSFSQPSTLKSHIRIHTGFKPYKCTECSKRFRDSSTLKTHIRIHTGSKLYKCTECSKSFTINSNLTRHMRTHTGSKPYKCAECNKCFSHNYTLKKHMRSHISS